MADTAVNTVVNSLHYLRSVRAGPIWIDPNTAYVFFDDAADFLAILSYQKTTDGGATWSSAVAISSDPPITVSVWYDQWTPGNAGTLIHIAYTEADTDDVLYHNLDTLDDTLSTEVVVFAGASFANGNWDEGTIDIVRARGGNLYIAFWGDADGEYGFYRSTDDGATWTSRTDVATYDAVDGILLMPGNETDENDIIGITWNRSANGTRLKTYDNSGDAWSLVVLAGAQFDDASYYQMSAAPRHSDNHVILAVWSTLDAATADLKVWDITDSSTITAMTNVLTDTDNSAQVAVLINQQNDDIYVAYLKGGTWEATVDVKYKKSTDGGTTWGAEASYSEAAADDIRALWAGISVGPAGGRFQPMFFNDDLDDLFVNLTNDVYFAPSVLPLRDAYASAGVVAVPSHGSAKV